MFDIHIQSHMSIMQLRQKKFLYYKMLSVK